MSSENAYKSAEKLNELGNQCLDSENYEDAVGYFRQAAEAGLADALANLGNCYFHGCGVEKSYEQAVACFKPAAAQGNVMAQFNLGICYYYGGGTERDYDKAFQYFKLAAEQGDSDAMYRLGVCYYFGHGTAKDHDTAFKYYQMAATGGDSAENCEISAGVGQSDEFRCHYLESEAAKQAEAECAAVEIESTSPSGEQIESSPSAMEQGEELYARGVSFAENKKYRKARRCYKSSAGQGNTKAMTALGNMYLNGQGAWKNKKKAEKYFKKAAELGNDDAQKRLEEI
ncbi:MAG: tetratricopeptide repeat protein [Acutalibacteraceae bacterium]|nr:tetratricopeptide repeat protein [Bacillota bacterium]